MITITNNGIYKSEFSIVDIRHPEDLILVSDDDIVKHLSDQVELGESVTFNRMFDIIQKNIEELNTIFYSCLGGYSITPFLTEVEELPTVKSELDGLEIFWLADKADNEVNIVSGLHGVGIETDDNGPYEKGDIISYAIEFTPLNNLKYLTLKLNNKLNILNYDSTDDEDIKIDLGDKNFTLFDIFYAILFEISWNGDPSGREDRLTELEESIEISKEETEKGETKSFDIEDLFDMFDKNDKLLVKYKDLRDRLDDNLVDETDDVDSLKKCLLEKLKIYDEIGNSKDKNLTKYSKKLSDVEFNLQLLYGVDEDEKFHRFWETPKCTCPKIDNVVKFPNGNYIFDKTCPIHTKL